MKRIKLNLFSLVTLMCILGILTCYSQDIQTDRNPFRLAITQTQEDYQLQVNRNPEMQMIDIAQKVKGIVLDIRYATNNNFTGKVIYTSPRAFARKAVVYALQKVQDSLSNYRFRLKIYDAYRPYSATVRFYEVYPDSNFVANPRHGSRHNRGCAVDVTLVEKNTGKEIPMPSAFDDFSDKANPEYSNLPDTVIANRKLLIGIMTHFGFKPISTEWWHFDFTGWENYPLMDLSFEELDKLSVKLLKNNVIF